MGSNRLCEEHVGDDLDVPVCFALALRVGAHHAALHGSRLVPTGSEHDPVDPEARVKLVLVQESLQRQPARTLHCLYSEPGLLAAVSS